MKVLKYENDWEYDKYTAGGEPVAQLKVVEIDDVQYPVIAKSVSVRYDDMGHVYTATSTHYFVEIDVLGVKTQVDLNTIVPKRRVYAVEYSTKSVYFSD